VAAGLQVYLIYCDGMSFSGTAGPITVAGDDVIHLEGHRVLQAFQAELMAMGLGMCSQGGAGGHTVQHPLPFNGGYLPSQARPRIWSSRGNRRGV
jgi:hypothetical protein